MINIIRDTDSIKSGVIFEFTKVKNLNIFGATAGKISLVHYKGIIYKTDETGVIDPTITPDNNPAWNKASETTSFLKGTDLTPAKANEPTVEEITTMAKADLDKYKGKTLYYNGTEDDNTTPTKAWLISESGDAIALADPSELDKKVNKPINKTEGDIAKVTSDGKDVEYVPLFDASVMSPIGDENTLGINVKDDNAQKMFKKLNDFKLVLPKAFDKVTLATTANLATLQAKEPTVTKDDLLFEFKAQDGTYSYIITPLDKFIDLTAIKKVEFKTTDVDETILEFTKIDDSKFEIDLARFYNKTRLDVRDIADAKDDELVFEKGIRTELDKKLDNTYPAEVFKREFEIQEDGTTKIIEKKFDLDDSEIWKKNTLYTKDNIFSFSTSNTTAKWLDGTKIAPNTTMLARYDINTTSNGSLTNAEMRKMVRVGAVDSYDSAEQWQSNKLYKANQIFFFEAINGSLDAQKKTLKAPHGYFGRYMTDYTTPSTPLDVAEIAKISTVSNGGSLFRDRVDNETQLQAVINPSDGETRQVGDGSGEFMFYTFNTNAQGGLTANDGTAGFWQPPIEGRVYYMAQPTHNNTYYATPKDSDATNSKGMTATGGKVIIPSDGVYLVNLQDGYRVMNDHTNDNWIKLLLNGGANATAYSNAIGYKVNDVDALFKQDLVFSAGWSTFEYTKTLFLKKGTTIDFEANSDVQLDGGAFSLIHIEKNIGTMNPRTVGDLTDTEVLDKTITRKGLASPKQLWDAFGVKTDNFADVGAENTFGINKDDDTYQKIVDKIEEYKLVIPKAFETVTLADETNLVALQVKEPTVTLDDLLFEFKAQDGTMSYVVTPLDKFIDLTAVKKIEYKTADAKETILKITKIDNTESELDLTRFFTEILDDAWKDEAHADYDKRGTPSFKQLDDWLKGKVYSTHIHIEADFDFKQYVLDNKIPNGTQLTIVNVSGVSGFDITIDTSKSLQSKSIQDDGYSVVPTPTNYRIGASQVIFI